MMPERQLNPELFNPFVPNAPSLLPENRKRFSDVFRGNIKGALGTNGLRKLIN